MHDIQNDSDDANAHVYIYDKLYQLTNVNYNDGVNKTGYSYDVLGNRVDVNTSGSVESYMLNDTGLNQYSNAGGYQFSYDDNGNLTSDGSCNYFYDCENRLESTECAEQVTCGDFSCSTGWDLGNENWSISSGQASFSEEDETGGTLSQDVDVAAGKYYTVSFDITCWNYDGDHEFAVNIGGVEIFDEGDYDSGITTYTIENVEAVNGGNLQFYAYAGEFVSFDVDIDNVSVVKEVHFRYDYLGRRVAKTYDGVTTKYCYDGDQVIAEYEGSTLKRKFIYGPGIDEPIMLIVVDGETETEYYYHFDGLGSVIALSDENGNVVEQYSYDVYGKPKTTSSLGNPYYFTGRRYDSETMLYYYRARYYNPYFGRFLSPDSWGTVPDGYSKNPFNPFIQYVGVMNLYTYCTNSPTNFVDPEGYIGVVSFGLGAKVTYHVALGGYAGYQCIRCWQRVNKLMTWARERMDPCQYENWKDKARPGSECAELCGTAAKHGAETAIWAATRFTLLRRAAFRRF